MKRITAQNCLRKLNPPSWSANQCLPFGTLHRFLTLITMYRTIWVARTQGTSPDIQRATRGARQAARTRRTGAGHSLNRRDFPLSTTTTRTMGKTTISRSRSRLMPKEFRKPHELCRCSHDPVDLLLHFEDDLAEYVLIYIHTVVIKSVAEDQPFFFHLVIVCNRYHWHAFLPILLRNMATQLQV